MLAKPYPHIFRNRTDFTEKPFEEASRSKEGRAAKGAYTLLQSDLHTLLEYIEPDSRNLAVFSHRTFEILLRACTEVESNMKTIFEKNKITLDRMDGIQRYADLEGPLKLSEYEIECRSFDFPSFRPFEAFADSIKNQRSPIWWKAYNSAKHNRSSNFEFASLKNVIMAVGAVYTIIDAQYGGGYCINDSLQRPYAPSERDIFLVKKLPTWLPAETYADFDWDVLGKSGSPFDYHPIPIR